MIKKIIYLIIIVVFSYLTWLAATKGIEEKIASMNIDIPNYAAVVDERKKLDEAQKEYTTLNSKEIDEAKSSVELAIANYETKKQEYDILALTASEEEIAEANKEKQYLLDFLWMRIGTYAQDNDIKWKMQYDEGNFSLQFDITGAYISVINFIYDLENDRDLNFKLENFVIQSSGSGVKASFVVEDVIVITAPTI